MATQTQVERKKRYLRDKIREWNDLYGRPPRVADWKGNHNDDWPSYMTVVRYFESWDQGMRSAGFAPRGRGRPLL